MLSQPQGGPAPLAARLVCARSLWSGEVAPRPAGRRRAPGPARQAARRRSATEGSGPRPAPGQGGPAHGAAVMADVVDVASCAVRRHVHEIRHLNRMGRAHLPLRAPRRPHLLGGGRDQTSVGATCSVEDGAKKESRGNLLCVVHPFGERLHPNLWARPSSGRPGLCTSRLPIHYALPPISRQSPKDVAQRRSQ